MQFAGQKRKLILELSATYREFKQMNTCTAFVR